MSSSQLLITPELLRFRAVWAVATAVFSVFARLWPALRNLTCGERHQAVVSAVGPRYAMTALFGCWPNAESADMLWNAGNQRCDWSVARFAGRRGPPAFRSSQHCRGRRPDQQVVDVGSGLSGRWT